MRRLRQGSQVAAREAAAQGELAWRFSIENDLASVGQELDLLKELTEVLGAFLSEAEGTLYSSSVADVAELMGCYRLRVASLISHDRFAPQLQQGDKAPLTGPAAAPPQSRICYTLSTLCHISLPHNSSQSPWHPLAHFHWHVFACQAGPSAVLARAPICCGR